MTYATRKARIREWIKADAERRQRDEIARRVAEALCPPDTRAAARESLAEQHAKEFERLLFQALRGDNAGAQ